MRSKYTGSNLNRIMTIINKLNKTTKGDLPIDQATIQTAMFIDMAQSLAVIADALSDKKEDADNEEA